MNLEKLDSDRRRFNRELISRYPMIWSLRLHYVALALWPLLIFIDAYYVATSWEKHESVPAIQQWSYFSALVALGLLLVWLRIQLRATQRPHLVGPFGGFRFFLGALFVSWSLAWVPIELFGAMRAHLAASISLQEVCIDRENLRSPCDRCGLGDDLRCIASNFDGTGCPELLGRPFPYVSRPMHPDDESYQLALMTVLQYGFEVPPSGDKKMRDGASSAGSYHYSCLHLRDVPEIGEALRSAQAKATQVALYSRPALTLHPPQYLPLIYIISTTSAVLATIAQTTSSSAILYLFSSIFGGWLGLWLILSIVFEINIDVFRGDVADNALLACAGVAALIFFVSLPLRRWHLARISLLFIMLSLPATPTALVWNWVNTGRAPETSFTRLGLSRSFFIPDEMYWFCSASMLLLGLAFAAYRPISQRAEAQPNLHDT